ncbi:hypothetical protein E4M16_07875 [Ligilactobacillus ruminis]|nr:hypothetical protein E4M16_07875 [Ligilactobacillus ruminis]
MEEVKTGSEPKYITLAVVEYDPDEGTRNEGIKAKNIIVSLPVFCRQVNKGDLITFMKPSNPQLFGGKVLAKQTYDIEGDYLPMLLLASGGQFLGDLPTVETKIEETKVTW